MLVNGERALCRPRSGDFGVSNHTVFMFMLQIINY